MMQYLFNNKYKYSNEESKNNLSIIHICYY